MRRYLLPRLDGLNLVLENVLDGGVNDSLNLDMHGKALSFHLLAQRLWFPKATFRLCRDDDAPLERPLMRSLADPSCRRDRGAPPLRGSRAQRACTGRLPNKPLRIVVANTPGSPSISSRAISANA